MSKISHQSGVAASPHYLPSATLPSGVETVGPWLMALSSQFLPSVNFVHSTAATGLSRPLTSRVDALSNDSQIRIDDLVITAVDSEGTPSETAISTIWFWVSIGAGILATIISVALLVIFLRCHSRKVREECTPSETTEMSSEDNPSMLQTAELNVTDSEHPLSDFFPDTVNE
jgi:hypothetical protein